MSESERAWLLDRLIAVGSESFCSSPGTACYALRLEGLSWNIVGLNAYGQQSCSPEKLADRARKSAKSFATKHGFPWPVPKKQ